MSLVGKRAFPYFFFVSCEKQTCQFWFLFLYSKQTGLLYTINNFKRQKHEKQVGAIQHWLGEKNVKNVLFYVREREGHAVNETKISCKEFRMKFVCGRLFLLLWCTHFGHGGREKAIFGCLPFLCGDFALEIATRSSFCRIAHLIIK